MSTGEVADIVDTDPTTVFVDPTAYADEERFHAACTQLRRQRPVAWVESSEYRPFWAITKHADIMAIERDAATFLSAPRPLLVKRWVEDRTATSDFALRTLIHMDDPDHRKFRAVTTPWFSPQRLRAMEDDIRALARRYIDHLVDLDGHADLVSEVAKNFPLHVILSTLGLPESDFPRMLTLTQELFGGDDEELRRSADPKEQVEVLIDYFEYFRALTADRRANPTDDLASTIANATIDGELLGDIDVVSYYVIIATAGHDTTSSAIAGGLHALAERPDQLARLQREPELLPLATEEIFRWTTPVKEFMRTAAVDTEVGGQPIAAGESVYLAYQSANRDEEVFDEPFTFDVGREDNRHLAFGFGPHFCLGANLARMETRIFLEELLPRLKQLELAGEPTRSATTFVGGIKHLPVSYTLRS